MPQLSPTARGFRSVMVSQAAYDRLTAYRDRRDLSSSQAIVEALETAEDGRPSVEWLGQAFRALKLVEKPAKNRWLRQAGYPEEE